MVDPTFWVNLRSRDLLSQLLISFASEMYYLHLKHNQHKSTQDGVILTESKKLFAVYRSDCYYLTQSHYFKFMQSSINPRRKFTALRSVDRMSKIKTQEDHL